MQHLTRRTWMTAAVAVPLTAAAHTRNIVRRFTIGTPTFEIEASVEYRDAVSASSLSFQQGSDSRSFCLSPLGDERQNCVRDFAGSLAFASYHCKPIGRERPICSSLTEVVRLIDRDNAVPDRAPFRRTIALIAGRATDIQVFGMKQSGVSRGIERASDPAWCLFRQELFWDQETNPFLVLHWKHTLPAIRLLDVAPVGSARVLNDSHPLL